MQKPASHEEASQARHEVFDLDLSVLRMFEHSMLKRKTPLGGAEMVQSNHSTVLAKFCDVCKQINLDPIHPHALPFLVMSKNKRSVESARAFMKLIGEEHTLETLDLDREGTLASCEKLLSSMGDWLTLFSFLELCWGGGEAEGKRQFEHKPGQLLRQEVEQSVVVRPMQASLAEAQVSASGTLPHQRATPLEVALLSLLYLSPRTTPACKMLERLYTDVSDKARDAELRCLLAMSAYKDTMDYEEANMHTMPLVMCWFLVKADFSRHVTVMLSSSWRLSRATWRSWKPAGTPSARTQAR
jgi:hypothetical protein